MAIEYGILSFEAVFMPYMIMADGRRMIEHPAETAKNNKLPPPPEAGQGLPAENGTPDIWTKVKARN